MLDKIDRKLDEVVAGLKNLDKQMAGMISTFDRKEIPRPPPPPSKAWSKNDPEVNQDGRIKLTPSFKNVAFVLSKHERQTNADWGKFLSDLQKYGDISEAQWRFFKKIHKDLLGTWPDAGVFDSVAPSLEVKPFDPNDEAIPF